MELLFADEKLFASVNGTKLATVVPISDGDLSVVLADVLMNDADRFVKLREQVRLARGALAELERAMSSKAVIQTLPDDDGGALASTPANDVALLNSRIAANKAILQTMRDVDLSQERGRAALSEPWIRTEEDLKYVVLTTNLMMGDEMLRSAPESDESSDEESGDSRHRSARGSQEELTANPPAMMATTVASSVTSGFRNTFRSSIRGSAASSITTSSPAALSGAGERGQESVAEAVKSALKTGWLEIHSKQASAKRRFFVLQWDRLLLFKRDADPLTTAASANTSNTATITTATTTTTPTAVASAASPTSASQPALSSTPVGILLLSDLTGVTTSPTAPLSLDVCFCAKKTFVLTASSGEVAAEWVLAIRETAAKESLIKSRTLRGYLLKEGNPKVFKRRWVVLDRPSQTVSYYKSNLEKEKVNAFTLKSDDLRVGRNVAKHLGEEKNDKSFKFEVSTRHRTYVFCADDYHTAQNWVHALNEVARIKAALKSPPRVRKTQAQQTLGVAARTVPLSPPSIPFVTDQTPFTVSDSSDEEPSQS